MDIEVNGVPAPFRMKLGDSGEAFFVKEIEFEDELDDDNLATSPLPGSPRQGVFDNQLPAGSVIIEEVPNIPTNEVVISIEDDEKEGPVVALQGSASMSNLEGAGKGDDLKGRKRRKKRRKNQVGTNEHNGI